MRPEPRTRLAVILLALTVMAAACGDDDDVTGSTEAVVFGEGTIPESVPDDFPIPSDAVVGTTLVDKINNRTEFRLSVRSDLTSIVRFFQVGLVNQGYIINSSDGDDVEWTLTFSNGELQGSVFTSFMGQDVSTSVISVNTS